jgi:protein-export membrane protein SecD
MNRRDLFWITIIITLIAGAIWIILNPQYPARPGLDLQGGLQVLLAADVPESRDIDAGEMDTARQIISQRINAIGVVEPLIQVEGDRHILVELPGIDDPEQAIELIQGTALLEFVDTGSQPLPEGICIRTTLNEGPSPCELGGSGAESQDVLTDFVFETIITGADLASSTVQQDSFGQNFVVAFELKEEAADIFEDYTGTHRGQFLTIVLDKQVVSSPRINDVIRDTGSITGDFTLEDAQRLALQLRYGSLPIPLRIETTRLIGATLGSESIEDSIRAGATGVAVVLLFMLIYYRLLGFLADSALIAFAIFNIAVFQWLGVTLTLPAIAGFLLSTGMAVDANILVFERMKEEIRGGVDIKKSVDKGFSRAWTSIRDSNVATLVICFILWAFGRSFGASMVQGFAITLAIGVLVSMFTALIVTRTLVRTTMNFGYTWIGKQKWLLSV